MEETSAVKCLCFQVGTKTMLVPHSVVAEVVSEYRYERSSKALLWQGLWVPVLYGPAVRTSGAGQTAAAVRRFLVLHTLYGGGGASFYAIEVEAPPRPLLLEEDLVPAVGVAGEPGEPVACYFSMGGSEYAVPDLKLMEQTARAVAATASKPVNQL